jgi:hypothetical protein
LKKETAVPLSSIIALSAIVAAFLLFAVVLAWADHQTTHLRKDETKAGKAPLPQGQSRSAAEGKAPALINS